MADFALRGHRGFERSTQTFPKPAIYCVYCCLYIAVCTNSALFSVIIVYSFLDFPCFSCSIVLYLRCSCRSCRPSRWPRSAPSWAFRKISCPHKLCSCKYCPYELYSYKSRPHKLIPTPGGPVHCKSLYRKQGGGDSESVT